MIDSFDDAVGELKRADHLFYVSLKYTRTVDMIKHVIERLISCFGYGIESVLKQAKEQKKVDSIPENFALRCELLKEKYPEDEELIEYINFLFYLRKLARASYTKREEFRRHVTMVASVNNGEIIEVNIDVLKEYYEKTKQFVSYVKNKINLANGPQSD